MKSFDELLGEAAVMHGHLCPGQVLGVRMAMLGCRLVGIPEPIGRKNLLVYVEIDRCAADAIQAVTGCRLGKRTLKYLDYGKLAATFVNLDKPEAVRVAAREDSRERAWGFAPTGLDKKAVQLHAYKLMPEDELFVTMAVSVQVTASDFPGHPLRRVLCQRCDEGVNDGREVISGGKVLCRSCATGAYYKVVVPAGSGL
jgi:formylmethanofuran dehydrogenase subunit E